jgi:Cdc6-like AAA superfamily ATPase
LDWLSNTDYGAQQSDFISKRHEGTGRWLLDSDEFQSWFKESKQTFFCIGIPGSGKTIITSVVVDHLNTKFENDNSVGIAYLYYNYRRQQEQKPVDLLASLLKQLIQRRSMPENVADLYKLHCNGRTRPSFEEISKVLHSVVAEYSRAFVVIDALDECQVFDEGCQSLLTEIFSLRDKTGASFFATSRAIPEITKKFEGSISLEIRAKNEDVERYLDGRMRQSDILDDDIRDMIRRKIIKAADGMYVGPSIKNVYEPNLTPRSGFSLQSYI